MNDKVFHMYICWTKSRGLAAWLWLFKKASQAKAAMKPSKWPGLFGPGLAWLTASGRALQSTNLSRLRLSPKSRRKCVWRVVNPKSCSFYLTIRRSAKLYPCLGMVQVSILLVEWHVLRFCKLPAIYPRPISLALLTHQILCLQRRVFLTKMGRSLLDGHGRKWKKKTSESALDASGRD